jgi:hypothetical protein
MPRSAYQWCMEHGEVERYPACRGSSGQRSRIRNAQVGEKEASAVGVRQLPDGTYDYVYCFGDDPSKPMPEEWAKQGYVKQQFHSFRELQKFCRETGQVNDIEGDWHKDDGFFEEQRAKAEKEHRVNYERYLEEREKVKRSRGQ